MRSSIEFPGRPGTSAGLRPPFRIVPSPWLVVGLAVLVVASGCSDGDGGGSDVDASQSVDAAGEVDAMLSPTCVEATMHSDFQWIQEKVFTPTCAAFTQCHRGTAIGAQGLNLEMGNAETELIGQPSGRFNTEILVVPGDPEASYILVALGSYSGPLSDTGVMPPSFGPLCVEIRDAIARWITSLATRQVGADSSATP